MPRAKWGPSRASRSSCRCGNERRRSPTSDVSAGADVAVCKPMPRVTVFTCLFGDYDRLTAPKYPGTYVCFTDQYPGVPQMEGWQLRHIGIPAGSTAASEVRRYKLQPQLYLDHEYSLYVDANFTVNSDPWEVIERFLGGADFALHRHPERDCIYDEAIVCGATNRAPVKVLARQTRAYERQGYPRHHGLYECGILLRKNTAMVRSLCSSWWAHVQTYSARDQVSFPVVCWQAGFIPKVIPGLAQDNEWFRWHPHGS